MAGSQLAYWAFCAWL